MDFDIDTPLTVSGAHWRLCYDSERDRAYTWTGVGPGSPEPIWNGDHPTVVMFPTDAVPSSVEDWARAHEKDIARYAHLALIPAKDLSDEDSDAMFGLGHLLEEDVQRVSRYWDAGDWVGGDPHGCLEEVVQLGLDGAVERNVVTALTDGAHIREEDLKEVLRDLAERSFNDMEPDDIRYERLRKVVQGAEMRAYVLDWTGTLDRLEDPVAFIRALNESGDYTIMYSGMWGSMQESFRRASSECQATASKGRLTDLMRDLGQAPEACGRYCWRTTEEPLPIPDEIVIADDDPYENTAEWWGFLSTVANGVPVRYVHPLNLAKELEP